MDALRTEVLDFQMASLPTSTTDIDVDELWASIQEICTVHTNRPVCSTILKLIRALLALPASNADSERYNSMLRSFFPFHKKYMAHYLLLLFTSYTTCITRTVPGEQ